MKTIIYLLISSVSFFFFQEKHTDSKQLNIDISKYERVHVYNTGGEVKVNASQGTNALIDSKRSITATNRKKLARAIEEIYLDTMSLDGELYIYISAPNKTLEAGNNGYMHYQQIRNNRGIRENGIEYEFELDIKLPGLANTVISTHRGDLNIDGIRGELTALNHHGNVTLDNVQDLKYAHSHHGDVKINFEKQSQYDVEFHTHHGDITVSYPSTPSVNVDMYSYHGSFFTDFDWQPGPIKIKKTNKNKKTKYKLGSNTSVLIGDGKKNLSFKSHHGDMYILKS